MVKHLVRLAAAVSLTAAFVLGAGATGAGAQTATPEVVTSITIHNAECRSNVGPEIFEECHDARVADVDFELADGFAPDPYAGTTDENGELVFDEFAAGTVTLGAILPGDSEYVGSFVYCRDLTGDEVLFEGLADEFNSVELEVVLGMEIVCDWYHLTGDAPAATATPAATEEPQATATPAATEVPASETVTELPATGTGSIDGGNVATMLLAMVLAAAGFGALAFRRRAA